LIFTFRNFGKGVAEAALGFPLKEGTGENTLVQTTDSDNGNKAITENSIALGEGSIAGVKGYYFSEIFYGNASTNPQIRIQTVQPKQQGLHISPYVLRPDPTFTEPDYMIPNYRNGDVFNLICNDHFALFGTIVSITNDVITFTGDTAFFKASLNLQISYGHSKMSGNYYINLVPDYDDYTLCVPRKPLNGIVEVCKTAFSSGCENVSAGAYGEATGKRNIVVGAYGHAEGSSNLAGYSAHAEGQDCEAPAKYSHAQNKETKATGYASTAMGKKTVASGECSTATNIECAAEGEGATAEGCRTKAKMKYSHTEGMDTETNIDTIPLADSAHAEGRSTKATNYGSHAEGGWTVASGEYSHAQNYQTIASGTRATAMGHNTIASGSRAVAEGDATEASGYCSHSAGLGTKAKGRTQFVVGEYNKDNSNALFIVGNGTSDANRSNALEVLRDGTLNFSNRMAIATGTAIGVIANDLSNGSESNPKDVTFSLEIPVGFKPMLAKLRTENTSLKAAIDALDWFYIGRNTPNSNMFSMSNDSLKFRHIREYLSASAGNFTVEYIILGETTTKKYNTVSIVDKDGYSYGPFDITSDAPYICAKLIPNSVAGSNFEHKYQDIYLNDLRIYRRNMTQAGGMVMSRGLSTTPNGNIELKCTSEGSVLQLENGKNYTFYIATGEWSA
jgi:hypothetical protein